ncbi:restriction endonuclease subunit S [Cupriavidus oxalaticus]|uniref:Restriction endonuclease subunit S n=2 Tax=Cupriavidus oxalaticus TaxID=96344 RepID=A0A375FWM9_9BURK|nr:restriction endonuclease subunit S [Cupriavidus oxalaticus]QRQ95935.1 restriction endonuclease subunit S [Cupriavidus oxalaticus]SPC10877.1 Restriction modification system DNA specificity domain-containing protein [Cupriavidus oxalaticus]
MSEQKNEKNALVPRLRFPQFREAGEWQEKELAKFLTESRIEGSAGDIAKKITVKLWGKGVFAKQESIKGSENTKYYKRRAGQFIYSKLDFLNQAFGIVPEELDGLESTVDLPCFDIGEELDPVFLLEYVKREDFYKKNGEIADGGRKAKRIQTEVFLSFPIALPAQKAEQQKIADCLSSLDELITAETQMLDTIKAHKSGLMQQLFPREGETVPRLRFPEFQDAGEWEEHDLGSKVTKVGSGITPAGGEKNYKKSGRPFVRSQNVGWGHLLLDDVAFIDEETHRSFAGTEISQFDVLLNITGASIGRSAVADSRIVGGNVNQHVCIIRTTVELSPIFLNQFLISQYGQCQIDSFQAGGNRQGLNFAQVRSFSIPLPPEVDEQKKIADLLSSLDDLIAAQSQKIDALISHKKGLMQQLFPVLDEVQP